MDVSVSLYPVTPTLSVAVNCETGTVRLSEVEDIINEVTQSDLEVEVYYL